jgi:hypothetical protein
VAATYIAHTNPSVSVVLTTYGSPRVGNTKFKDWSYNLRNLSAWRYVYQQDPIPRSNPLGIHVGHLVQIESEKGKAKVYWRHDGCKAYSDKKEQATCLSKKNYKAAGKGWYNINAYPSHHDMKKYEPYVKKKSNFAAKFEVNMEKE